MSAASSVATQAPNADASPSAIQPPAAAAKKRRTPVLLAGLTAVTALAMGGFTIVHRGMESTDDAQVEGRVMNVSSRVPGQVSAVKIEDNQIVEAGAVLFELDSADFAVKVELARSELQSALAAQAGARAALSLIEKKAPAALVQAKGNLTSAQSSVSEARASIERARADLIAAESRESLAQLNVERARELLRKQGLAKAELDAREHELRTSQAVVQEEKAKLLAAQALLQSTIGNVTVAKGSLAAADTAPEQIESARAVLEAAEARVTQAKAALHLAELNLSYTVVRAPRRGMISKRSVEQGQMVGPERPLLAIVPLDEQWVVANFKEDQLSAMQIGQQATVTFDTYPGKEFHGKVSSIAAGTGARFALLPPDNASGNFVKVVQRVPVLVQLSDAPGISLRPGMSAEVTVDTRN